MLCRYLLRHLPLLASHVTRILVTRAEVVATADMLPHIYIRNAIRHVCLRFTPLLIFFRHDIAASV